MESAVSKQENPSRDFIWPLVLPAVVVGVGAAVVIDWVLSGGLGLTGFLAAMAFTAGAVTLRVVVGLLAAVFR